jgi:ABC-type polysaccharide/polyol phosphate export permease
VKAIQRLFVAAAAMLAALSGFIAGGLLAVGVMNFHDGEGPKTMGIALTLALIAAVSAAFGASKWFAGMSARWRPVAVLFGCGLVFPALILFLQALH